MLNDQTVVFGPRGTAKASEDSNKGLTISTCAGDFERPENHRAKYDIIPIRVGADPRSAMQPMRGTGYYKFPSLKGVWYRGPFEHNGSVAMLEDWFDPAPA